MPAYSEGYYDAYIQREEDPLLNRTNSSINAQSKPEDSKTPDHVPVTARRCILNAVMISVAYFLAFSGFSALRNLESSISTLGEISLSIVGFSAVAGAYFSPLIVHLLGEKGSVIGMWTCMTCLVAANFYPVSYTLFPIGGLFGFMAGPGWTSQLSYTTNTAIKYAKLVGKNEEEMVEISNGIFYFGYSCSQVVGNVIGSLVLYNNQTASHTNISQRSECGVKFCPSPTGPTSTESEIPKDTLYALFGIFIAGPALAFLASLIFLDPLKMFLTTTAKEKNKLKFWSSELMAPLKMYKDVRMLLLLPVLFFSGMEQIVMFSGFSEAFVSCAIGVEYVGYIMMCWGMSSALASLASGVLSKFLGRAILCSSSLLIALALQVYLYIWDLTNSPTVVFFIVSSIWGVMDGILQTQLSALLGLVFQNSHNPAFANFRMLSYLGFAVSYGSTAVLCQKIQIYLSFGTIVFSLGSYIAVEIIQRRKEATHKTIDKRAQYRRI